MNAPARILARPDALDLYETLASAGRDIRTAADSIYLCDRIGSIDAPYRASARSAARRVLAALDEYEREMG